MNRNEVIGKKRIEEKRNKVKRITRVTHEKLLHQGQNEIKLTVRRKVQIINSFLLLH